MKHQVLILLLLLFVSLALYSSTTTSATNTTATNTTTTTTTCCVSFRCQEAVFVRGSAASSALCQQRTARTEQSNV